MATNVIDLTEARKALEAQKAWDARVDRSRGLAPIRVWCFHEDYPMCELIQEGCKRGY